MYTIIIAQKMTKYKVKMSQYFSFIIKWILKNKIVIQHLNSKPKIILQYLYQLASPIFFKKLKLKFR
jgi:hypothetical protein